MKVSQLQELLQHADPESEVMIDTGDDQLEICGTYGSQTASIVYSDPDDNPEGLVKYVVIAIY